MATTYNDSGSVLSFELEEAIDKLCKANKKYKKEMNDLCKEHGGFRSYIQGKGKC